MTFAEYDKDSDILDLLWQINILKMLSCCQFFAQYLHSICSVQIWSGDGEDLMIGKRVSGEQDFHL